MGFSELQGTFSPGSAKQMSPAIGRVQLWGFGFCRCPRGFAFA